MLKIWLICGVTDIVCIHLSHVKLSFMLNQSPGTGYLQVRKGVLSYLIWKPTEHTHESSCCQSWHITTDLWGMHLSSHILQRCLSFPPRGDRFDHSPHFLFALSVILPERIRLPFNYHSWQYSLSIKHLSEHKDKLCKARVSDWGDRRAWCFQGVSSPKI